MDHAGSRYHPCAFQFDRLYAYILEHSHPLAEQERYQVNIYLVKQSELEALSHDAGAGYRDVPLTGDLPGFFNGAFNPIDDERERRAFVIPFLGDGMGNNKDWDIQRVSAAPGRG